MYRRRKLLALLLLLGIVLLILTQASPFMLFTLTPIPVVELERGDYADYKIVRPTGVKYVNGTYVCLHGARGYLKYRVLKREGDRILMRVMLSITSEEQTISTDSLLWIDLRDNSVYLSNGKYIGRTMLWIPRNYNPSGFRISEIPGMRSVKVVLIHHTKGYITWDVLDQEDYVKIRVENVSELKPGQVLGGCIRIIEIEKMKGKEMAKIYPFNLSERTIRKFGKEHAEDYFAVIIEEDKTPWGEWVKAITAVEWGTSLTYHRLKPGLYSPHVIYDAKRGIALEVWSSPGVIDPILYAMGVLRLHCSSLILENTNVDMTTRTTRTVELEFSNS